MVFVCDRRMNAHAESWGRCQVSGSIMFYLWNRVSHWSSDFIEVGGPSKLQGSAWLLPPMLRLQVWWFCLTFTWMLGIQTQVLILAQWVLLPSEPSSSTQMSFSFSVHNIKYFLILPSHILFSRSYIISFPYPVLPLHYLNYISPNQYSNTVTFDSYRQHKWVHSCLLVQVHTGDAVKPFCYCS